MKKTLLAAALTLGVAGFAQAANINVGGVVWDPDYADGGDRDFLAEFSFTQWFSMVNVTEGSSASLQSSIDGAVNLSTIVLDGTATGTGFYLSGGGEFDRVNDPLTDFCPGCELTFSFGGLELQNNGTISPTGAWINVWVDDSPDFVIPVNDDGIDGTLVSNGDLWLSLDFNSFDFLVGGVNGGSAFAELQVDGGIAANHFLDSEAMGIVNQVASAFFFEFQDPTTILTFSTGGNGSVRSETVPEPGSLALIGLGLLGAGLAYRRKHTKAKA